VFAAKWPLLRGWYEPRSEKRFLRKHVTLKQEFLAEFTKRCLGVYIGRKINVVSEEPKREKKEKPMISKTKKTERDRAEQNCRRRATRWSCLLRHRKKKKPIAAWLIRQNNNNWDENEEEKRKKNKLSTIEGKKRKKKKIKKREGRRGGNRKDGRKLGKE